MPAQASVCVAQLVIGPDAQMENCPTQLPELLSLSGEAVLHGHHDDLGETEAEIARAGGKSRRWIADLLAIDALGARLDDLLAQTRVDILVNNAATFIRQSALELSLDRWREVQTVNLDAVWLLCQRIGAGMVERGAGKIINI